MTCGSIGNCVYPEFLEPPYPSVEVFFPEGILVPDGCPVSEVAGKSYVLDHDPSVDPDSERFRSLYVDHVAPGCEFSPWTEACGPFFTEYRIRLEARMAVACIPQTQTCAVGLDFFLFQEVAWPDHPLGPAVYPSGAIWLGCASTVRKGIEPGDTVLLRWTPPAPSQTYRRWTGTFASCLGAWPWVLADQLPDGLEVTF